MQREPLAGSVAVGGRELRSAIPDLSNLRMAVHTPRRVDMARWTVACR